MGPFQENIGASAHTLQNQKVFPVYDVYYWNCQLLQQGLVFFAPRGLERLVLICALLPQVTAAVF